MQFNFFYFHYEILPVYIVIVHQYGTYFIIAILGSDVKTKAVATITVSENDFVETVCQKTDQLWP